MKGKETGGKPEGHAGHGDSGPGFSSATPRRAPAADGHGPAAPGRRWPRASDRLRSPTRESHERRPLRRHGRRVRCGPERQAPRRGGQGRSRRDHLGPTATRSRPTRGRCRHRRSGSTNRQRLPRQRPADGSSGEALRRPQPPCERGRCPQPGARRRSGNRRHNTRRRHRWNPGTGRKRRPRLQRGRAATVGPRPKAGGHPDPARYEAGTGFPAVDRPSADSSRGRATGPDWIVAGSSESTFSLPQPTRQKKRRGRHPFPVSSGRRGHRWGTATSS